MRTIAAVALVSTLAVGTAAACRPGPSGGDEALASGEAVYTRYCASCHGSEGDGQGPAAYLLFPKPRNFQAANYKLRTTPQGVLPTDEDLAGTIRDGMPGTPMFGFRELLNEGAITSVVQYVKSFSPAFVGSNPPSNLLRIPEPPAPTPELVAGGEEVYGTMRCGQCHGPAGRGDGPSAPTLRDSQGDPFPAADFTRGIYKSGGTPQKLYRTLLTGMSGTPMPSYAEALQSDSQAWALVYYLVSLAPGGKVRPASGDPGPVVARRLRALETAASATVPEAERSLGDAGILDDPEAEGWSRIPSHRVYMRPLWFRNRYPLFIDVRAVRTADRLSVLLEWEDTSRDQDTQGQGAFTDGAAVQLAAVDPPPFVGMGQRPGGEVEIWFWRADRQLAADTGSVASLPELRPNMIIDRYPYTRGIAPYADATPAQAFAAGQEAPFVTGRDAGNPGSDPEMLRRPVHTLQAGGFGTLTTDHTRAPRASGRGVWTDGTYRVLFSAPLAPGPEGKGVDLRERARVPIAVAVWNGADGDRNGTKIVSQWVELELEGE